MNNGEVNIPHVVLDMNYKQAVMDVVNTGHGKDGVPFIDILVTMRLVSGQIVYLSSPDKKPLTARIDGDFEFIPVRQG